MPFAVRLTDDAARDLEEIHEYIATHDSARNAEHWLSNVERAFTRLNETPDRGSIPKQLAALGIREYRQIDFKPYLIIYQSVDRTVYVMLIADGWRDTRSLLEHRLLGAD